MESQVMLRCTEEVVRRIENPVDHMLGVLSRRMRQGNALFRTWKVASSSHQRLNSASRKASFAWLDGRAL